MQEQNKLYNMFKAEKIYSNNPSMQKNNSNHEDFSKESSKIAKN